MNSKNGWPVIKKLSHFSFNTCLLQQKLTCTNSQFYICVKASTGWRAVSLSEEPLARRIKYKQQSCNSVSTILLIKIDLTFELFKHNHCLCGESLLHGFWSLSLETYIQFTYIKNNITLKLRIITLEVKMV